MTKKPNASCLRLLLGMTGLLITSSNGRTLKNQTEALPKNRTLEGVAHAPRAPCRVLRAMSALGHFREIGTLGREPREKVTILRKKFSAAVARAQLSVLQMRVPNFDRDAEQNHPVLALSYQSSAPTSGGCPERTTNACSIAF